MLSLLSTTFKKEKGKIQIDNTKAKPKGIKWGGTSLCLGFDCCLSAIWFYLSQNYLHICSSVPINVLEAAY